MEDTLLLSTPVSQISDVRMQGNLTLKSLNVPALSAATGPTSLETTASPSWSPDSGVLGVFSDIEMDFRPIARWLRTGDLPERQQTRRLDLGHILEACRPRNVPYYGTTAYNSCRRAREPAATEPRWTLLTTFTAACHLLGGRPYLE